MILRSAWQAWQPDPRQLNRAENTRRYTTRWGTIQHPRPALKLRPQLTMHPAGTRGAVLDVAMRLIPNTG